MARFILLLSLVWLSAVELSIKSAAAGDWEYGVHPDYRYNPRAESYEVEPEQGWYWGEDEYPLQEDSFAGWAYEDSYSYDYDNEYDWKNHRYDWWADQYDWEFAGEDGWLQNY